MVWRNHCQREPIPRSGNIGADSNSWVFAFAPTRDPSSGTQSSQVAGRSGTAPPSPKENLQKLLLLYTQRPEKRKMYVKILVPVRFFCRRLHGRTRVIGFFLLKRKDPTHEKVCRDSGPTSYQLLLAAASNQDTWHPLPSAGASLVPPKNH